jgi:hypothetical protein
MVGIICLEEKIQFFANFKIAFTSVYLDVLGRICGSSDPSFGSGLEVIFC